MGLIIFSLLIAVILGGLVWLAAGDRLPPGSDRKWDSRQNVLVYVAILWVVVYIIVFILF